MNDNNRITITLALVVLLMATLLVIKSVTNRDPEEIPSRESTQEEKLIEENKEEEKIPEEEHIKEILPIDPELPKQEPEEPEIILLSPQEQARDGIVEKYGEEVVSAWERLSRDENFDYIGYQLVVEEHMGPDGELYYPCYKIFEDGTYKDAYVGGDYYIYGVFVSTEALFDLVDYHNAFFAIK
jgi:hypothetical protein